MFSQMPQKNNLSSKMAILVKALKEMYSKHLVDISGDDAGKLFVKIRTTPKQEINIMIFNLNTNTTVSKKYAVIQLLIKCSDIFSVNHMIQEDCKTLYEESKQTVYKKNTIIEV